MEKQKIKNRTTGKVIEREVTTSTVSDDKPTGVTLDKSMTAPYKRAVAFWASLSKQSKKTIEELGNLGDVLLAGKQSVNNNNQIFGAWRQEKFPGMTARYASYAIQLSAELPAILEVFTDLNIENRQFSNPESVMNAYRKATKPAVEPVKPATDEGDAPATDDKGDKVTSLEVLTPEARIESFTLELNLIIEGLNKGSFKAAEVNTIKARLLNALKIINEIDEEDRKVA